MLIPTPQNVRNITDFRTDPDSILKAVQGKSDPLYLFRGSTPMAVVLDLAEFARLHSELEDYYDSLLAQELEKEPYGKLSTLDDILQELDIKIPGRKTKKALIRG